MCLLREPGVLSALVFLEVCVQSIQPSPLLLFRLEPVRCPKACVGLEMWRVLCVPVIYDCRDLQEEKSKVRLLGVDCCKEGKGCAVCCQDR